MTRTILTPDSRVNLARHARLRFDGVRGRWMLLVPEKVMTPDDICVEILQLCDGQATIASIAATLEQKYVAEPGVIAQEVLDLLQDLSDRGFLAEKRAA